MGISGISSNAQSASSSSSTEASLTTLKNMEQKIKNEIKQLEKKGADQNSEEIKQLQKQLMQISEQITEMQASNTTQSTTIPRPNAGSAYTVELSEQSTQRINTTTNTPNKI